MSQVKLRQRATWRLPKAISQKINVDASKFYLVLYISFPRYH